ncbi:MAG: hypothetical protein WA188_12130 [Terriglobales bacterium]
MIDKDHLRNKHGWYSCPTVICEVAKENAFAGTTRLGGYTLFVTGRGVLANTPVWDTVAVSCGCRLPNSPGIQGLLKVDGPQQQGE